MSQLGYYAKRCKETKGLEHEACIMTLRRYIRETPKRDILSAVDMISDPELIRSLWEAGLDTEMQEAVLKRLEELTERRR